MPDGKQLYHSGDIYTVDETKPTAEAVAVKDGMILTVGDEALCRAALGDGFESIDLEGCCLLPGFIDTHLHPLLMIYFDMNVDLRSISSMDEVKGKIREMALAEKSPDAWVVGLQFDEEELDEPRFPDRHDLNEACPDRPAIIIKHDGHTVFVNDKALQAANITKDTPDPAGGKIGREPGGTPSGIFFETASQLMLGVMPIPELQALATGAEFTFAKLAAHGITTIGSILQTDDEGPAGGSGAFDVLGMQMFLSRVPINMYTLLIAKGTEKIEEARKTPLHTEESGGHRVGGIKIYCDGTFGSATALMDQPFTDQPDKQGYLTNNEQDIYSRMEQAHLAGMQVAVHAIGDRANRLCVGMFERLLAQHPRQDHRHRIEHGSIMDEQTIRDIARLGLVVSTQPMFIHSEKHWLHKRLGRERAKMTYPFRSLLDAGVRLAGASDAPVESIDVLHAIQVCVTREGFETHQGITVEEAIRMFTIDAAYAQFEDRVKGSISAGKRADFVILSKNPVKVLPEEITDIQIVRTVCRGEVIYCAGKKTQ